MTVAMDKTFEIQVKDKIAKNTTREIVYVCGNSDYSVHFTFDEEWSSEEVKTARFSYDNGQHIDVPFKGNECEFPLIMSANFVNVGVYAGNLRTSTDAYVSARKGALSKNGTPADPPPDVYNQIVEQINAGMLKGEQGEKGEKGDKGDAGSIKFIPVAELPTENIDTSAIYLLPVADSTDENRFTEYVYIDGKWETIGAITVQVDHSEYVKFTDYATNDKAGVVKGADGGYGIYVYPQTGIIRTWRATEKEIDRKVDQYRPIVPAFLDHAVKVGITTNTETLNDEEKAAALAWLGAVGLTDYASTINAGVMLVGEGLASSTNGKVNIRFAQDTDIDAKTNSYKPITSKWLDYAVKKALTDCKIEWTEEEKTAARKLLGIE